MDPQRAELVQELRAGLKVQEKARQWMRAANIAIKIGDEYMATCDYQQSKTYYSRALQYAREAHDKHKEVQALARMGATHHYMSEPQESLLFYKGALECARLVGDKAGCAGSLCGIGNALVALSQYDLAIEKYDDSLSLAEKNEDLRGQATARANLGNCYLCLSNFPKAIECFNAAMHLFQHDSVQNLHASAITLGNLGETYMHMNDFSSAAKSIQESLRLSRELGDQRQEAAAMALQGHLYLRMDQTSKAQTRLLESYSLAQRLNAGTVQIRALQGMGEAFCRSGLFTTALDHHMKALELSQSIGDVRLEGIALNLLGDDYLASAKPAEAKSFYTEAIKATNKIGDRYTLHKALLGRAVTLQSLPNDDDSSEADKVFKSSLHIIMSLGDKRSARHVMLEWGKLRRKKRFTECLAGVGKGISSGRDDTHVLPPVESLGKIDKEMNELLTKQGVVEAEIKVTRENIEQVNEMNEAMVAKVRDEEKKSKERSKAAASKEEEEEEERRLKAKEKKVSAQLVKLMVERDGCRQSAEPIRKEHRAITEKYHRREEDTRSSTTLEIEKERAVLVKEYEATKAKLHKSYNKKIKTWDRQYGDLLATFKSEARGLQMRRDVLRTMVRDFKKELVPFHCSRIVEHVVKLMAEDSRGGPALHRALNVWQNIGQRVKGDILAEAETGRKAGMEIQAKKGNIRVFCRCRPLFEHETSKGESNCVDCVDNKQVSVFNPSNQMAREYDFDHVFSKTANQANVFDEVSSLMSSVTDGYNVCIFAYGQTGSGKTHTMEGYNGDYGLNFHCLEELFKIRDQRSQDSDFEIQVTVMEIYNEKIRDLLSPCTGGKQQWLDIRMAQDQTVYVEDLTHVNVNDPDQVLQVFEFGRQNRATASTNVHEHSSRSHCLFCIEVISTHRESNLQSMGKLNLVDLAGSERVAKSAVTGDRLKEAQAINKSLSALGDVIQSLTDKKKSHVPYRNSKLTHLLQDSLGGNSKTLMFVNISPGGSSASETNSSLTFGSRVRKVVLGQPTKNVSTNEVEQYREIYEALVRQVQAKRG